MLRLFTERLLSSARPIALPTLPISARQHRFAATMTSHFSNDDLKISKLFDVSKIKAVVTGGGTGIGLMITQALATNGATVYITGRRKEALEKVVSEYGSTQGKIVAVPGDITSKDECLRLAKEIEQQEPNGIHLLVNNAGIARDDNTKLSNNSPDDWEDADALSKHMLESDPSSWASTFETNVTSQFFMAAALVPLLAKANKNPWEPFAGLKYTSSIVNITSISGLMKGSSSGKQSHQGHAWHIQRLRSDTFQVNSHTLRPRLQSNNSASILQLISKVPELESTRSHLASFPLRVGLLRRVLCSS